MEEQYETPATVETDEEFSDEFQCCVCLDLLYKPVVLACGHISCFWCVFRAMDLVVSHCPVCRQPYNHFPSICQLLHFVLLKLYPKAYKRKEQQVTEEEKRLEWFSPQLDNCLRSESSEGLSVRSYLPPHSTTCSCNSTVCLGSCYIVDGEPSTTNGSESTTVFHKEAKMSIPAEPNFGGIEKVASEQYTMLGGIWNRQKNSQHFLITDFHCAACEELLYQPVVLNCGHVFCEVCIISPTDRVPICQVCQSAHPNGCPKVCLLLKQFLEEQFSEQYALRKENVYKHTESQSGSRSPPTCSIQSSNHAANVPSISTNPLQSWLSGRGPKVHIGVGCDYCGVRCKDCKESIGFDLCEGCYNSSSKLPGRFNQQHTPEHKFENIQLDLAYLASRLGTDENEFDSPNGMGGFSLSASHLSSDDTSENQEDAHSI
ncbi:hypothetical protein Vadar_033771 [Vaccinium darrowii]|uniref:Uncharacterized protein n=1 Tax=Vaccinium darrowii TaxID=229202 RepID=A0ACB7X6U3_9ERIC|nr:hypothetical protein Vadar_033771 [Vaccinium darrowii]